MAGGRSPGTRWTKRPPPSCGPARRSSRFQPGARGCPAICTASVSRAWTPIRPAVRPNMDRVVERLLTNPAARRLRVATLGAVAVLVIAAFWTGSYLQGNPARRCQAGRGDPGRRVERPAAWRSLAGRYAQAGKPTAWPALERQLDRFADQWRSSYRQTCAATFDARMQPEALLDLRLHCLRGQQTSLNAFVAGLGSATPGQLVLATSAVMPDPVACQTAGSAETKPLPIDGQARAQLAGIEQELARSLAQQNLGDYAASSASASPGGRVGPQTGARADPGRGAGQVRDHRAETGGPRQRPHEERSGAGRRGAGRGVLRGRRGPRRPRPAAGGHPADPGADDEGRLRARRLLGVGCRSGAFPSGQPGQRARRAGVPNRLAAPPQRPAGRRRRQLVPAVAGRQSRDGSPGRSAASSSPWAAAACPSEVSGSRPTATASCCRWPWRLSGRITLEQGKFYANVGQLLVDFDIRRGLQRCCARGGGEGGSAIAPLQSAAGDRDDQPGALPAARAVLRRSTANVRPPGELVKGAQYRAFFASEYCDFLRSSGATTRRFASCRRRSSRSAGVRKGAPQSADRPLGAGAGAA